MFIDFVIHICDRIMRQTAQQNPTIPCLTNLAPATQETINKPHTTTTVLLVENEPALLDSFREALEQSGYKVLTADSGESAIGICRQHIGKIDVLVSDVVMNRVTGFEVAANIKATHPNVIVILMSGSPRSCFQQHGITHDFLQKPFPQQQLLTAISRHKATSGDEAPTL
jgi:two-component system, cell cycle sensor histidine kinase and response regulator CckA